MHHINPIIKIFDYFIVYRTIYRLILSSVSFSRHHYGSPESYSWQPTSQARNVLIDSLCKRDDPFSEDSLSAFFIIAK